MTNAELMRIYQRLTAVEVALTGPQNVYTVIEQLRTGTADVLDNLNVRLSGLETKVHERTAPTGPIVDGERDEINRRLDVELGNLRGQVATLHQLIAQASTALGNVADHVGYSE